MRNFRSILGLTLAACCVWGQARATTITETFNKADGALGPNHAWTQLPWDAARVVSNKARLDGTSSTLFARANSDLAGADHYAQIEFTEGGTGGATRWYGVMARKDSSTTHTYYVAFIKNSSHVALYKSVTGSLTQLGSDVSITFSAGAVLKLSCNGSTISVDYAGVNKISQSDSSITSGTRCGLVASNSSSGITVYPEGDNFEAGDLGGGAPALIPKVIFIGQVFNPFKGTAWSALY